eukprot:9526149-Lingulodinium_polyedra.AAC.1
MSPTRNAIWHCLQRAMVCLAGCCATRHGCHPARAWGRRPTEAAPRRDRTGGGPAPLQRTSKSLARARIGPRGV